MLREGIERLQTILSMIPDESARHPVKPFRVSNAMRPAVSLPLEILSSIFEWTCLTDASSWEEDERSNDDSNAGKHYDWNARAVTFRARRRTLYSVCFRWRQVCLATSSLWSTMVVTGPERLNAHVPMDYRWLSLEVERARPRAPVLLAGFQDEWEFKAAAHYLGEVTPDCGLISITLDFKTSIFLPPAFLPHPALHTFVVSVLDAPDDPPPFPLFLPIAPALRTLVLILSQYPLPLGFESWTLESVEHLVLDVDSSLDTISAFVKRCPNVHTLSILDVILPEPDDDLNTPKYPPLALPRLRNVRCVPIRTVIRVLCELQMAQIEQLSLSGSGDLQEALSEGARCSNVHLLDMDYPQERSIGWLPQKVAAFPKLATFVLQRTEFDDHYFLRSRLRSLVFNLAAACSGLKDIWILPDEDEFCHDIIVAFRPSRIQNMRSMFADKPFPLMHVLVEEDEAVGPVANADGPQVLGEDGAIPLRMHQLEDRGPNAWQWEEGFGEFMA